MSADYFDSYNPDLLKLIPPDAKVVLEIGCGAGRLAEAYRRVNPGVVWLGVESNQDAADTARDANRVTDVLIGDAEEIDLRLFPPRFRPFECLVLGDILEHLIDPWAHLDMLVDELAPGAQILASIPNVGHWTVIRDLLKGQWTYTDDGLMDRTHLRFFTLASIRELFEQAGLQIHEIRGRDIGNEGLREWLKETGIEFLKEMKAFQFLVRAVKPNVRRKITRLDSTGENREVVSDDWLEIPRLHLHAILGEACCARPRILEPFAALETVPGVRCTTAMGGPLPRDVDIVILQRHRSIGLDWARQVFEAGSLIIAELDDDPEHPLYTHGEPFDPLPLKAVHAVQVSTERLAEIVREWNPNVMVFENQIADLPPWEDKPPREQVRIFYGAQNRQADWAPIMPALNRLAAETDQVFFVVVHDIEFFEALQTPHKSFKPFCDYAEYRSALRFCDIALLPLEPGQFNECKSDIKFLECAAEGVVALASQTVYEPTVRFHQNECLLGVIYTDSNCFTRMLRRMIDAPKVRRDLASNAYEYVRDHRLLGQHFRKRLAWYQSLRASKPALDQSLRERVPELFHSADRSPQRAPVETRA